MKQVKHNEKKRMIKKIALPALTVLLALGAIASREMEPVGGTMATPVEGIFYGKRM